MAFTRSGQFHLSGFMKIVEKIVKNHRIERNIDIQDIYRITEEVKRNYEGIATIKN